MRWKCNRIWPARQRALLFGALFLTTLFALYTFLTKRPIRPTFNLDDVNNLNNDLYNKLTNLCSPPDQVHLPTSTELLCSTFDFLLHLSNHERRIYSQNLEDGITDALLTHIGGPKWKFFVEIGVENGDQCNTRFLREKPGWRGVMFDKQFENKNIQLFRETITYDNVQQLFEKYAIPRQFDVFSLDTDFKDYWILLAILQATYRPRIIVCEVNSYLLANKALTVPRDFYQTDWDSWSDYFGFSIVAGWKLARQFNYTVVYCENSGVNCFLVQNSELHNLPLTDFLQPEDVWKPPVGLFHQPDTMKRPYVTV